MIFSKFLAPVKIFLPAAVLIIFHLSLINMYLLHFRWFGDIVVVGFVGVAAMALATRVQLGAFLRGILFLLALAAVLQLTGVAASREVLLAEAWRGLHGMLLIAAFLIFVLTLLKSCGAVRVMMLLFVAGALGAALASMAHLLTSSSLTDRLVTLGRPQNPIPAAASMAAAGLAGLALLRNGLIPHGWRVSGWAAFGVIVIAVLLTQSRGPLLGLALGIALICLPPSRALWIGAVCAPLAFLLATSLVLFELQIHMWFCRNEENFCRPSMRLSLWHNSIKLINDHPLWGLGSSHQMGEGWLNNPQNAVLAIAVYFGIPFLLITIYIFTILLKNLRSLSVNAGHVWAASMMVFSAIYYAFEPNPFAYYNAHYIFLWLPIAVILKEKYYQD